MQEKQTAYLNEKTTECTGQNKLFRMVCDTSHNAFLYYIFEKDEVVTLGNWDSLFQFRIKDVADFPLLLNEVMEEKESLSEALFAEAEKKEQDYVECKLKDGRTWLSFEVRVSYDSSRLPVDKIICIKNITRYKNQQEELEYLSFYDNQTALYNRNYFIKLLT